MKNTIRKFILRIIRMRFIDDFSDWLINKIESYKLTAAYDLFFNKMYENKFNDFKKGLLNDFYDSTNSMDLRYALKRQRLHNPIY